MGEHAADPDGGVGQVDDDVPGRVQGGRDGADGHGFAGTDLAGDDPDRALIHTPADSGDRFTVAGAAVQHRRSQARSAR